MIVPLLYLYYHISHISHLSHLPFIIRYTMYPCFAYCIKARVLKQ